MEPKKFANLYTSRTIKPTGLSNEDIDRAVQMGKFEPCEVPIQDNKLPWDVHGVNTFAVPELKGRRRLITEPHLNAVIAKHEVPRVTYPSRLSRRQSLRYAKYMLQIDFEAYYDSIPLPECLRNNFVFLTKDKRYMRLCTLPTGARWSVAVGQAVTNVIVDIDTPVIVHTLIDNIMIAAHDGMEKEFLSATRRILERIRTANLLTSPDRDQLLAMDDRSLLTLAQESNVFLGEEYAAWNGTERLVRNSSKTVAKIMLCLEIPQYTNRAFASAVSLLLYALHTTQLNPASAFKLLRAYRGVYRNVERGQDWDAPMEYLETGVRRDMQQLGREICVNKWWTIAEVRRPTYEDHDYGLICYTDASAAGWGAIVQSPEERWVRTYQQKWIPDFVPGAQAPDHVKRSKHFSAKFSAHAEPRAVHILLKQLVKDGVPDGTQIAVVTDHFPIVHAQKKLTGFGGIGRGYSLNKLYEYTYDLLFKRNIQVVFFYLTGKLNPADQISRNFGVHTHAIVVKDADDMGLPPLKGTRSSLCDEYVYGVKPTPAQQ
eukprot:gene937-biopygen778